MSEFNELAAKLLTQEAELRLVISEAEAKIDLYKKTISEGRAWLNKVKNVLDTMFGTSTTGQN